MKFFQPFPRAFLVFLLLLYTVCFVFFLNRGVSLTADSVEYLNAGSSLLKYGHWYAGDPNQLPDFENIDFRMFSKRPPGYPVFLLLFGKGFMFLLAQILASAFGLWLGFHLIFKEIASKYETKFWWIAGLLLVLSPAQFYYSGFVMSDLLLQTFVLLGVYSYKQWQDLKAKKWLWASSLSLSLALIIKPVVLPLVLFLAGYSIVMALRKRLAYLVYILPFLVWMMVSFLNQKHSGQFEYSSIGSINTVQYNGRVVLSRVLGKDSAEAVLEPLMYLPHNKDQYALWKAESASLGLRLFLEYPMETLKFHVLGSMRMPFDPGRFEWALLLNDPNPEEGGLLERFNSGGWKSMWIELVTHKIWALLLFLMLLNGLRWFLFLYFVWLNRKDRMHLICSGLVFYFILIAGPIGASRFLMPVLPLIIWGATKALYSLTEFKPQRLTQEEPREAAS